MQEKNKDFSLLKRRILEYADYKGIGKADIYKETGITNGIFSQKNGINEENLLRFLNTYQDINTEWLLRGEGDMILGEVKMSESNHKIKDELLDAYRTITQLQKEIELLKNKKRSS